MSDSIAALDHIKMHVPLSEAQRIDAVIAALTTGSSSVTWQPIDTCKVPQILGVIVAVPGPFGSWVVGEARTHDVDGDHVWYWAGNDPGDYHGGPIVEINHAPPKFWQPLPAAPTVPST